MLEGKEHVHEFKHTHDPFSIDLHNRLIKIEERLTRLEENNSLNIDDVAEQLAREASLQLR